MDVALNEILDEAGLRALLAVAVADATPEETMPPAEGPPGWTDDKQRFFLEFFRPAVLSQDVAIFAIVAVDEIAGFIRLKRMPEETNGAGTAETGMWLGRSYRGKGLGAAALDALLAEAAKRGYSRVVADTTPKNVAALGVLRRGQARLREGDGKIYAEIAIDPGYASNLEK
jgi:RimJ/RimL family protein N-acetyltransferase